MYVLEGRENGFTSIPRSIYWAIVTLTTVGYGDISPKTAPGQMLASLVMVIGYAIIAIPTGIVTVEPAQGWAVVASSTSGRAPRAAGTGHGPGCKILQALRGGSRSGSVLKRFKYIVLKLFGIFNLPCCRAESPVAGSVTSFASRSPRSLVEASARVAKGVHAGDEPRLRPTLPCQEENCTGDFQTPGPVLDYWTGTSES